MNSLSPAKLLSRSLIGAVGLSVSAIALTIIPQSAQATVLIPKSTFMFPPTNEQGTSGYRAANNLHAQFNIPGFEVRLNGVYHTDFGDLTSCPDGSSPVMGVCKMTMGRDQQEIFGSILEIDNITVNGVEIQLDDPLISLTTTKVFKLFDKNGNLRETGTFKTQITQEIGTDDDNDGVIDPLVLPDGTELRLQTTGIGSTTVNDFDDNFFSIQSFFDIFPEISIDGGDFVSGRRIQVVLVNNRDEIPQSVPEPSTAVPLALLGLAGLWGLRKKQLVK